MSFTNFDVDLESQVPFSDSPEFDRTAEEASNALLEVNNQLVTLRKLLSSLETRKGLESSDKLNTKCFKSIENLTDSLKSLGHNVKELTTYDELNASQLFTREKVSRELRNSLLEFQELQDKFTKVTTAISAEAKTALEQHRHQQQDQENSLSQRQEMVLEQDEINNEEFIYQQSLIREREEEIQNIEYGIQELNQIFGDLGAIVQEQGTMVDNIESNIYRVSGATKDAAGELSKALRYQRRSGRRTLCLLMIVGVILAVVLLGILI